MNEFNLRDFLSKMQDDTMSDLANKFNYFLAPDINGFLGGFIFAKNMGRDPWDTPDKFLRDFHDYVLNFNSIFAGYDDRSDKFTPLLESEDLWFKENFYKNMKTKPNIVFCFSRDKKGNIKNFSVVWTDKEDFPTFVNSGAGEFESRLPKPN